MKKLAVLLAATAAFASSHVMALPPTTTPELEVTLSGASAQDEALRDLIESLCETGTLDFYNEDGSSEPEGFNAYFCTILLSNLTDTDGDGSLAALDTNSDSALDVLIYKRSAGGSGQGPLGLCDAAIDQVLVDGTCVDDGTGGDPVAGDGNYLCPNTSPRSSDGGLSDLEFNKLPQPAGSVCNGLPVVDNAIWGTIFNTPVSLNLRNALQCVQGLTVGAEDVDNMPGLTKSVIASIFNGAIENWDLIFVPNFAGDMVPLSDAVADLVANGSCPGYDTVTFPIPSDTRVRACRRVATSGTNTQFRVKFLNAPCTLEAQDQLPDNTPFSDTTTNAFSNWQNTNPPIGVAPAIIETSGSSDMRDCIQAFSDTTAPATQRWAIGIQSTQNNVGNGDNYRFIKVDGAAPTVEEVIRTHYFNWVESVWSWLSTGDENAIDVQRTLLSGTGGAASVGALVTGSFTQSFGASGLVALNTIPGNVPSIPISPANPVATSTHAGGGLLSACRTPQVNTATPWSP